MNITAIFNSVRDMTYRIPLALDDQAVDCDKKHRKLYKALTREGFKVRFRVCAFLWSEQKIPKRILRIPHTDKCEHLYLEIFLNGKWVALDATWDAGLKKIFKVNEWSGTRAAELAVEPLEILPPRKNISLSHNADTESFLEDIRTSGAFYKALNEWLDKNRENTNKL